VLQSFKGVSVDIPDLPAFFHRLFRQWKLKPTHLVMGSRSAWLAPERRKMTRVLRPLAPKVIVMSDVVSAWLAAFGGRAQGKGILTICGTGSVAYGKTLRGKGQRTGGRGPVKGDEGSGFWIGNQWRLYLSSRRQPGSIDGPRLTTAGVTEVRKIASLAHTVFQSAKKKNPRAREILREAQTHLAHLIIELHRKLKWKGVLPVAFSGSIFSDHAFREGVLNHLSDAGIRYRYTPLACDAATAAARSIFATRCSLRP